MAALATVEHSREVFSLTRAGEASLELGESEFGGIFNQFIEGKIDRFDAYDALKVALQGIGDDLYDYLRVIGNKNDDKQLMLGEKIFGDIIYDCDKLRSKFYFPIAQIDFIREQSKRVTLSPSEIWVEIDNFSQMSNGFGVPQFTKAIFEANGYTLIQSAVVEEPALPKEAPATWKADRKPRETPPQFVKRFYDEHLGKGLTRAHFRKLDPDLWQALTVWLRRKEMPPDVDLPTRAEQNRRWIERVERDGIGALPGAEDGEFALREARRLLAAKARRTQK